MVLCLKSFLPKHMKSQGSFIINMFKILNNLATDGKDWSDGEPLPSDWETVDVRMLQEMDEDTNPPELYKSLINGVSEYLLHDRKVCIQCSGGVSRSNAIAVG